MDVQLRPEFTDTTIVPVLSHVLKQLVARNDKLPFDAANVTIFHALKPPAITIKAYLERIVRYAPCSNECFIFALVYIDKLIQANPLLVLTSLNIHRLLITSVMIAAKYFDDCYYNNAYYARVGGISVSEMNALELEFLFRMNFSLHVERDVFDRYQAELAKHTAKALENAPVQPIPRQVHAELYQRFNPEPSAAAVAAAAAATAAAAASSSSTTSTIVVIDAPAAAATTTSTAATTMEGVERSYATESTNTNDAEMAPAAPVYNEAAAALQGVRRAYDSQQPLFDREAFAKRLPMSKATPDQPHAAVAHVEAMAVAPAFGAVAFV